MNATCCCGDFPTRRPKISPRVLVVDDEPLVRWSIATALQAAGFDAVTSADAADALNQVRRAPAPDLVILDHGLCRSGRAGVLDELRAMTSGGRVMLLAVTGQDVVLPEGRRVDVIRKPYDLDVVIDQVRAALRGCGHDARFGV